MKILFSSLVFTIAVVIPASSQTNSQALRPSSQQLVSPEVHPDRTVTFRARAPGATNVSVWGEWSGG